MAITNPVKLYHDAYFAGQVADLQLANKVSRLNKSGSTIPYGLAVARDGVDGFKLPGTGSTAADFLGIPERAYQDITDDGKEFGTRAGKTATIVTMGAIAVLVAADVTAGELAAFSLEAGKEGRFLPASAAASGATSVAIPDARFLSDAKAGEIALLTFRIGG